MDNEEHGFTDYAGLLRWASTPGGVKGLRGLIRILSRPEFQAVLQHPSLARLAPAILGCVAQDEDDRVASEETADLLLDVLRNTHFPEDEVTGLHQVVPLDDELRRLIRHPCIVVVIGHRGSGKTAACIRIQELMASVATPYVVGLPEAAAKWLPVSFGMTADLGSVPNNSTLYIPEAYRMFHARQSSASQGQVLSDLVNLCRHRGMTVIFDVQNPNQLDRNILSEADVILVKEPGPFSKGFDRPELADIMAAARAAFAPMSPARKKKAVWAVAPGLIIVGY